MSTSLNICMNATCNICRDTKCIICMNTASNDAQMTSQCEVFLGAELIHFTLDLSMLCDTYIYIYYSYSYIYIYIYMWGRLV